MPIQCCFDVEPVSKSQFHEMDHLVMHNAFCIQNELGRFYDECVYQKELARRCIESGLSVVLEGEILVSCDSFRKSYYLDAVINSGSICELKAVESLTKQHESQLLNYLFLSNLQHGKLINFSPPSVEYRFVTTTLRGEDRMNYKVDESMRLPDSSVGDSVRDVICRLLAEWGAFLDISLYREAVFHFLGGEDTLLRPTDIFVDGQAIGSQKFCCLNEETCLYISATVRHFESYKKQLFKMLEHTGFRRIEWVNFNRATIQLITLKK